VVKVPTLSDLPLARKQHVESRAKPDRTHTFPALFDSMFVDFTAQAIGVAPTVGRAVGPSCRRRIGPTSESHGASLRRFCLFSSDFFVSFERYPRVCACPRNHLFPDGSSIAPGPAPPGGLGPAAGTDPTAIAWLVFAQEPLEKSAFSPNQRTRTSGDASRMCLPPFWRNHDSYLNNSNGILFVLPRCITCPQFSRLIRRTFPIISVNALPLGYMTRPHSRS
jgi:hypothetical protein